MELTELHKQKLRELSLLQYKNISNLKMHPGHTLFKMVIDDGLITNVPITSTIKEKDGVKYKESTFEFDINSVYVGALNLKSAIKKFVNLVVAADFEIAHTSFSTGDSKEVVQHDDNVTDNPSTNANVNNP